MLTDMEKLIISLGAYSLGAVYLGGVIASALVTGNRLSLFLALLSAGTGYLCQLGQAMWSPYVMVNLGLMLGSIFTAVIGGVLVFA